MKAVVECLGVLSLCDEGCCSPLYTEKARVLFPNAVARRHQLRLTEGDGGSLSQQHT